MDRFSQACKDFGLTISLKKTNVLGQSTETPPSITIDDYELDAVHQFTYLGSTITDNVSLDAEIDKRIGKAATTHAHLTTRVWTNPKLTAHCSTVARHGPLTPGRKGDWILSTWESFAASLGYRGRTRCPTLRSCLVQACPACTQCPDSADTAG